MGGNFIKFVLFSSGKKGRLSEKEKNLELIVVL